MIDKKLGNINRQIRRLAAILKLSEAAGTAEEPKRALVAGARNSRFLRLSALPREGGHRVFMSTTGPPSEPTGLKLMGSAAKRSSDCAGRLQAGGKNSHGLA